MNGSNKDSSYKELELLALIVHVILAVLHGLAVVFNWRRAKRPDLDTVIHLGAGLYDATAAAKHWRRLI